MSTLEVDKIIPQSGSTTQLGESGDTINIPSGVTFQNQGTATGLSSPEVYGFSKNASGQLLITTTGGGSDNISKATYATFDDCLFAGTGYTFSISNGDLMI